MATTDLFAPPFLRQSSPVELVSHFRSFSSSHPDPAHFSLVASELLALIHNGDVPPEILDYWLPLVQRQAPCLIKVALLDTQSQGVCNIGLIALRRALRRKQWKKQGWGGVGGANGLCEVFQTLSARHMKRLVTILGKSMQSKGHEGHQLVDELFRRLLLDAGRFEESPNQGIDTLAALKRRPMISHLIDLFQATSFSFLAEFLSKPLPQSVPVDEFLASLRNSHVDLRRKIIIGTLKVDPVVRSSLLLDIPLVLLSAMDPYEPQLTSGDSLPSSITPGLIFALDVLEAWRLSLITKDQLPQHSLLESVVIPAAEQAARRMTSFTATLRLLQLAFEIFTGADGKFIDCLSGPFPRKVISSWAIASLNEAGVAGSALSGMSRPKAEHRKELEELVCSCTKAFEQVKYTRSVCRFPRDVFNVSEIQASMRLPLIKLLCCNLPGINLDLDAESISGRQGHQLSWESETFSVLPLEDSKWLFEKLSSLGLQDRIDYASGDGPRWYRKGLLDIKWESEDSKSMDYPKTRKLLGTTKKVAETERDPDQRKSWAERAVTIVTLSGSISLLHDVTQWARRFLRDPSVGPYIGWELCEDSVASILACTSFPPSRRPVSGDALSELIQEANKILQFHLQTALLALREPGFKSLQLDAPLYLLRRVLELRFDGIRHFRKLGLQSHSELAAILLDSTLPIVIEYERAGISEGYEALDWGQPTGVISSLGCNNLISYKTPSFRFSMQFLDRLAQERNRLWTQERIRRNPSITSLGRGFPKGLPIQHLLPYIEWDAAAVADPTAAPYVFSRLQDIVFCDPIEATQSVPDDAEAIGPFVDNLRHAVQAYVTGKNESPKATIEVWDHYTKAIPPTVGHVEELRNMLLKIVDDHHIKGVYKILEPAPLLPSSFPVPENEPMSWGPVEWDPMPHSNYEEDNHSELSDQDSDATILHCRFKMDYRSCYSPFNQQFTSPEPWMKPPTYCKVDIWKPNANVRKLPLPDRERLVVSAMLFLDSFAGNTPRLFSTGFPVRSSSPRYPTLYLDYDFLSSVGTDGDSEYDPDRREAPWANYGENSKPSDVAIQLLYKLKPTVPPQALEQLASALVQSLGNLSTASPKYPEMTKVAIQVLGLLTKSDRPQLAVGLGLQILKNMPDASSWHRHVMSSGFAKQLDFVSADGMLEAFGKVLVSSLEKRTTQPSSTDANQGETTKHIKVTTLKMLPQLIQTNPSMSLGTALEGLRSLFSASSHIDVRYEISVALLSLFEKYGEMGSKAINAEIFSTLTSFVLNAAGPSERIIVPEAQWLKAEKVGQLPEVHSDRRLLNFLLGSIDRIPLEARGDYTRQVILKILDESTRQHNRWMRILLSRIELSPDEASITDFGPFWSSSVSIILRNFSVYLPKSYLLRERDWLMRSQDIPLLQSMDEKLMAQDPEWDESDSARQHWKQFLESYRNMRLLDTVHRLLFSHVESKVSGGITTGGLEEEYFERAQILLRNLVDLQGRLPQVHFSYFETKMASLSFHGKDNKKGRHLLERILRDTESLRASSNNSQSPPILPSRMLFQALLLRLPRDQASEKPESYSVFADELVGLVEECARSPLYLADFAHLEKRVDSIVAAHALQSALAIGKRVTNIHHTLHGCLSIQLMLRVLKKAKAPSKNGSEDLKTLMSSWKESPVEWVRRIAWEESVKLNDGFSGYGYCH